MQLTQLKLAGFKSFVDPTLLTFPSPLVAVVGPNGCGKSNIIDAIRWVMGESSAKHLRGDSMTDVIFNGSSHRKPIGQASVELVFDNSLGRVIGPFASYNEISIKRVLTRDGESTYYLNGSRCRRRDVMDIFLGTGAGVRGYSIISQGDVSRLIEAKPEALRGYLEEAAGISKYKERRRETLTRIQHTRENLLRLADIREELGKQLQRLEKQGKAATRYLQLKEEERLCRAEILALKWRDLSQESAQKQEDLARLSESYSKDETQLIHLHKERMILQQNRQELESQGELIQKHFYESGTEITRLQENIHQLQREALRLAAEKQQLSTDYENAEMQKQNFQVLFETACEDVSKAEAQLSTIANQIQNQQELFKTAFQQQQALDEQYAEIQINANKIKQQVHIAEVNWNNYEQQYQQIQIRLERLAIEAAAMNIEDLEKEILTGKVQQEVANQEKMKAEDKLNTAQDKTVVLRQDLRTIEQKLHQTQDNFHQIKTQHATLNAIQGAATKPVKNHPIADWQHKPRLVETLKVEPKWQFACEFILADQLKALILEDNEDYLSKINLLAEVGENITTLVKKSSIQSTFARLSDKIQGEKPLFALNFDTIFAVDNLAIAIANRNTLQAQESFITPEGIWLGAGWICIAKPLQKDNPGLLARQEAILALAATLEEHQQILQTLKDQRDDILGKLQTTEQDLQTVQKNHQQILEVINSKETKLAVSRKSLQLAKERQRVLNIENEELHADLEELILKKQNLMEDKYQLKAELAVSEARQQQLFEKKQEAKSQYAMLKVELDDNKTQLQQYRLAQERATLQIKQMQEGSVREQERLNTFTSRLEITLELSLKNAQQYKEFQQKLAEAITAHQDKENQLQQFKEKLAQKRQILDDLENKTKQQQAILKATEQNLSNLRLEIHALAVRIQSLEESLAEQSLQPSDLILHLPNNLTPNLRETGLSVIMENISKLGAINLAAIEEYKETCTRKENLDAQYNDLQEALSMLESAIAQMDKETQQRLANTFTQVNELFQALFPRLFGGGKAYLELTSSNLLEAGVVVMAQPPGKRNSTIQLLSGGEKAMTALALVFAIFQLNPSPFCMLDEVDAPLDDVNVVRFCNLVKEMSKFVQFLFITHNKVTMELAEQLIGVTMREPGVSRLVTVDIIDIKDTILE